MTPSPSPFRPSAWQKALQAYPGPLGTLLSNILTFGAQLGYTGPPQSIISENLASSLAEPSIITNKLRSDIQLGRASPCQSSPPPYICSPLGLAPKSDGGWRRIHHLSFPEGNSVNSHIPTDWAYLRYTSLENIFTMVRHVGRGAIIVKKDLKDAFRMIPVAYDQRWLLGFQWDGQFYHENCLPFGLRTSPFIFNLFAEGLHWVIQAALHWDHLEHYLDDFIAVFPPTDLPQLPQVLTDYDDLAAKLGLLPNTSKDAQGTCVEALGIEIDTAAMTARLPPRKLQKAIRLVSTALDAGALSLRETQKLAGFLSFCSAVVVLGRTHLQRLWGFSASFQKPLARRPLSHPARLDLEWWRDLLPRFNGVRLIDGARPSFHFFTDASSYGLGAFFYPGPPHRTWRDARDAIPARHAFAVTLGPYGALHINHLEILAIEQAFLRWSPEWRHGVVTVHTDNTTAFSGIANGVVKGPAMPSLRTTLLSAATQDITLHVCWLASTDNALADALSRHNWPAVADLCPQWNLLSPSSPILAGSR